LIPRCGLYDKIKWEPPLTLDTIQTQQTGPNPESKVFDSRIWTLVDDKIEWMLLDIRVTSGSSLH